jgi:anti-sigma factor RsiW
MDHETARSHLLDLRRDALPPELRREVIDHLDQCPACARASAAEGVLSELLEQRLPRHAAPPELKRRLAQLANGATQAAPPAPAPLPAPRALVAPRRRWLRVAAPALAAALVAIAAARVVERATSSAPLATLTTEAVNDHLRVLHSEHPIDVASGGQHQVKPWFEGKLGFAPTVPAPVGPDMRLEGGSVGYFVDREAAVIVYGLRRHAVTLLVFPADGLSWPARGTTALGGIEAHRASSRGFHVVFWRSGGLGYALVSDVAQDELSDLAAKLAAQT